jgi:hypothetical protein
VTVAKDCFGLDHKLNNKFENFLATHPIFCDTQMCRNATPCLRATFQMFLQLKF